MGEVVTLTLTDALYNAGIVGFMKVCDKSGLKYEKKGNQIEFDSDIFDNFTEHYLNTLIEVFQEDTVFTNVINKISKLEGSKNNEGFEKVFDKDFNEYIKEKMSRKSYIAAYKIIKSRGERYDYQKTIKNIKASNDYDNKLKLLVNLKENMQNYKDVFILKDVAYTFVSPFWNGIAFLNKQKLTDEFTQTYEDKFILEAKKHTKLTTNRKKTYSCILCGSDMNKSDFSLSQFNGIGIDAARKTSYFWNYNNYNAFLCPVCALIYSCMPLGFNMKYSEGVFINCNSSVELLEIANSSFGLKAELEDANTYQSAIDNFIFNAIAVVVEKEIDNIQVVRMTEKGYIYNVLSKDKLYVLHNYSEELKNMVGRHYTKTKNKEIYIFKEVLKRIFNNISLYPIIYEALLSSIRNDTAIKYINNILLIQRSIYFGGEKKLEKNNNYRILLQGDVLRNKMMGDGKNEKKVKSLSYVLINDLRMKNAHDFLDKLLRQYITLGITVPSLFLDALNDEDTFLNAGYAFLIGLNGGCLKTEIYKSKDAQNKNEQAPNDTHEEEEVKC